MTAMHPTVVAFDVDRTLTVRDCVVPFMRRVAGPLAFGSALIAGSVSSRGAVLRRDRDVLKAEFVRRIFEEVTVKGIEFAADIASSWMRSDVVRRLRWHQEQDHVVLLVSASLDPYLEPLGDLLEVDAVLCTILESVDGIHTGRLVGPNCRAAEKAVRIASWCGSAGLPLESLEWAYGDSSGDAEMLELSARGVLVSKQTIGESAA